MGTGTQPQRIEDGGWKESRRGVSLGAEEILLNVRAVGS
jgi:hypothetical protein